MIAAALVLGGIGLVLAIPPVLYGALAWWKFGFLRVTGYMPYEELLAAVRDGGLIAVGQAPLVSVNMTSGLEIANMWTLSLWQLAVSLALGALLGLIARAVVALRATCPLGVTARQAAGAGTGLLATVAASGTGLLACCGPAMSGGVLVLMGVTGATAHHVAEAAPPVQAALVGLVLAGYLRLRRRLRRLKIKT